MEIDLGQKPPLVMENSIQVFSSYFVKFPNCQFQLTLSKAVAGRRFNNKTEILQVFSRTGRTSLVNL